MRTKLNHSYEEVISVENLLDAWQEFLKGKRRRRDVQEFSLRLMDNILALRAELVQHTYRHGGYQAFSVHDPKPRSIHKASVRDRLLHHAIYRVPCPFFDRAFTVDSYSCRIGKGTHRALRRFREFGDAVSKNNTRTCWVLKCDVKKFFASIDQDKLLDVIRQYIPDADIVRLLEAVIRSFSSTAPGKGLPLGNLTSQLLVNVYLNEFDQFVKHTLRAHYHIRYADDFVILSDDRGWLEQLIPRIRAFLAGRLRLTLHPDKVFVRTLASGVDFLGWVHFPDHRVLRTTTKKRMMKRITERRSPETRQSYLGLLKHGNTYKIREELANRFVYS